MSFINYKSGQPLGKTTYIGGDFFKPQRNGKKRRMATFKCKCGEGFVARVDSVVDGRISSCGCQWAWVKHGHTRNKKSSPEYVTWLCVKNRCTNKNDEHYPDYGGRGISVSPEWINSFETFLAYVGHRPSRKHTLDRYPDNNGNYEPGNVRWATPIEQSNNKRNTKYVTYNNETLPVRTWSERTGIRVDKIRNRVFKLKWDVERALTTI